MARTATPKVIERRLYQEAGSRCPVCGEPDVSKLTVHHIVPYAQVQNHHPEAMIVLCANCHMKAERREITEDELFEVKKRIASSIGFSGSRGVARSPSAEPQAIHVGQQVADEIVNVVGSPTIKFQNRGRRKVVVAPLPHSVSEAQLREIDDQAAKLAEESGGRITVGFLKRRIMDQWSLTAMRNLPESEYPEVLDYLRRFRWNQRRSESGSTERSRLIKQAHARALNIGWSHDRLSEACREWYGQSLRSLSKHLLKDLSSRLVKLEE